MPPKAGCQGEIASTPGRVRACDRNRAGKVVTSRRASGWKLTKNANMRTRRASPKVDKMLLCRCRGKCAHRGLLSGQVDWIEAARADAVKEIKQRG